MLPERLSNGVCSLNPSVDRLTHSVFVEFDKNGRAKDARFVKSVIRSAKRLTYKEAYTILQGKPNGELSRRLHTAWELASLLRRKRFEQGSLDLDFPEVKVHVDVDGKPTRLERIENDESHQLIEEFMLAANEAVACELRHRSIATIYRVHEDPDPEKLGEYREFILSFGHKVGDLSHRKEIQRFLASIRGKPEQLEDRNPQGFRAAIMEVRNYGLVVELPDALVTGVVHVSTLADDFYRFDTAQRRLVGRRTNRRYSVGQEIRVFVARVDTFKRQIDFAIADQSAKGRPRRR